MSALAFERSLRRYASEERRLVNQRYFKTGKGQYGEHDTFIGVSVPHTRLVAKQFCTLEEAEVLKLLCSPIHELRLAALIMLVERFKKGDPSTQERIYKLYLKHMRYINNWDLVDSSSRDIVGGYLYSRDRSPLYTWAASPNLWRRRIAVIATQYFIKQGETKDILSLATLLLADKEDLIHKAVGWMLREMGRENKAALLGFLDTYAARMPRTMLRYAIEHFSESQRKHYLSSSKPALK